MDDLRPNFDPSVAFASEGSGDPDSEALKQAAGLESVFDVPVRVQAVLGRAAIEVNQLLKLAPGAVVELDRRVGEAIDIFVNDRLVARGEVVLVDEHLGVTMTEIVKQDR
jgi:flagellar motor switch protein FliN/FliY